MQNDVLTALENLWIFFSKQNRTNEACEFLKRQHCDTQ